MCRGIVSRLDKKLVLRFFQYVLIFFYNPPFSFQAEDRQWRSYIKKICSGTALTKKRDSKFSLQSKAKRNETHYIASICRNTLKVKLKIDFLSF